MIYMIAFPRRFTRRSTPTASLRLTSAVVGCERYVTRRDGKLIPGPFWRSPSRFMGNIECYLQTAFATSTRRAMRSGQLEANVRVSPSR